MPSVLMSAGIILGLLSRLMSGHHREIPPTEIMRPPSINEPLKPPKEEPNKEPRVRLRSRFPGLARSDR
jgi:hypothetical protein